MKNNYQTNQEVEINIYFHDKDIQAENIVYGAQKEGEAPGVEYRTQSFYIGMIETKLID
jgi:hypothetical protein